MAMSLFGTKDVVGRELKLNEGWKFYISAVFEDIPENSHLNVNMFLNWQSLYYYIRNYNVPERTLVENPGNHNKNSEVDVPIIYADYYYLEALLRLSILKTLHQG